MDFTSAEELTSNRLALLNSLSILRLKRQRELEEYNALKTKIEVNKTCINEFRYGSAAQADQSQETW